MVDTVLEVGAVRYEMLEPCSPGASPWTPTSPPTLRPRRRHPRQHPQRACGPRRPLRRRHPGHRHRRPASGGPKSAQAAAAAGTVGKGHLEQAGRWTGWLNVDGTRYDWDGAHGNRGPLLGPRRWGGPSMCAGSPSTSGRTCTSAASAWAPRPATCTGAGCGTVRRPPRWPSGSCVPNWPPTGVTHEVVHLTVRDKRGHDVRVRGDVLRVADIGRAGGTMVNEGLARWTYDDPPVRPAPATASASTCTSSTTAGGLSSRSSRPWPTGRPAPRRQRSALGQAWAARARLRRLSGGASRVTSSFDLEQAGGTRP